MGRKPLSYVDAVKLLGGESRVVAALSKLAGTGLSVVSFGGSTAALSLFELKGEVERLGQYAVVAMRSRFVGLSRFKRSELLEAAHAVLVVSSFFTALDDLGEELNVALDSALLELTGTEQAALATGSRAGSGLGGLADMARAFIAPGAVPGLDAGLADQGHELLAFYTDLAGRIGLFAAGTAVWEEQDETTRNRWSAAVSNVLPLRALARYEEQLGRLAGDFPEFAFWAHRVGVHKILDELYAMRRANVELGTALHTLAGLMRSKASGADAGKVRCDLAACYRAELDKPIAGAAAASFMGEVTLPTLRQIYVNPSYRILPRVRALAGAEWVSELRWQAAPPGRDLWVLVLEHLISTDAARVPLVLLGQPGAGKSVFTQMLAAELDPHDYLVVRVELRAVPSDAGIQQQIEAALVGLTGRLMPWPELAADTGDAQPVIVLDGFDELLQASGVSHFDFLERVQAFQEREASLGRPVAVLVTSRTAVAGQVRYPDGTAVARLEEFSDDQVGRWLATWNQANTARPLPAKTALGQSELSRQPLLLFMLALFHSGGGALIPGISQAQLYQRLFTSFIEREVSKLGAQLSDQQRRHAIERELDLMSMVAFAMFNRGRQSVTEIDLVADLTALHAGGQPSPEPRGAVALTIAEQLAGRFFFRLFVQRDQALRAQQAMLSSYEFLHASFGEFLIGRWVVGELIRLVEHDRRTVGDLYRQPADDTLLHTLLSNAVLSTREQRVLEFIAELLTDMPATEIAGLRTLAATLLRGSFQPRLHDPYPQYQPVTHIAPAAYAAYSANLILLLLLIAEADTKTGEGPQRDGLPLSELYRLGPASAGPHEQRTRFLNMTRLWHAQLTASEWDSLLDVVCLQPTELPDATIATTFPELRITRWRPADHRLPVSARMLLPHAEQGPAPVQDSQIWIDAPVGRALREATLLGSPGYQGACIALLPYLHTLGTSRAARQLQLGDRAADMLALLITPMQDIPAEHLAALYARLLDRPFQLGLRQYRLLLDRLRDDMHRLPQAELTSLTITARHTAWTNITAYLDVLAHLYTTSDSGLLDPHVPRDLRLHRDLSDLSDPHVLRDLLVMLGLPSLHDLHDLPGLLDPRDLHGLLDLCDLPGLLDLLVLRDLLGLQDLDGLRDLLGLPPILGRSPLTEIALWAGLAQRGLPVGPPPTLPPSRQMERMNIIIPEFVSRTRQLAAEGGYPDPFSADPAAETSMP